MFDNGHATIALAFATTDQILAELYERYSSMILVAVEKQERDDNGFIHAKHGPYLTRRGLYAVMGEHLDHEARMNFEEYYNRMNSEEEE